MLNGNLVLMIVILQYFVIMLLVVVIVATNDIYCSWSAVMTFMVVTVAKYWVLHGRQMISGIGFDTK